MNEILNPYIAGAPVVEASMFFGREDVFSWIERSLGGKYVDHILVLHGQRRVGKTSVLKQIPNFLPKRYIQVFFDLQGRTSTSLDRFLWWLASEIARTLKKERDLNIPRPDRKAFEDTETLINEFLPGLRPLLGDQVLLLTFDEFDTLDRPEIQESLALPLIAYLHRLMETEGLNFVFSIGSSGDKLENMQASYTDFFKSALYRKISFLTRDDCHRLITKPVEGTIQYERKAVDRIVEITSGHPYFTQLMCHELFALCQKTGARTITAADVESILGDVIERGTVNLKFVWDEANDLEKWILAGLAQLDDGAPLDRGATTQKLNQLLQAQRVRFSESDLNSAVIHLRDKDVITQDNRFIIHLMRMWLQANRPLDRVREELVEVNPIANRYIEIGDEYRDMGQAAQAIESYQQALRADPGNLKAQASIGTVHLEGRAYVEAAATFESALQIDDEDMVARTGFCDANLALGNAARKKNEIETAIGFYEKILVVNPAHTDGRLRLAEIYRKKAEDSLKAGQDDTALSAFNRAMDYTPEDDALAIRYDEVLAQKKAKVVAEWLGKAEKSLARQRWDEAANAVEEALKLDPDNADLQAKLLEVKDAPRQFKIQEYRGEAEQAIKRGNFEKAVSALETAIQLAPEDKSLADWLEATRSDQLNVRLKLYRDQARKAAASGDWETAIAARKEAIKLAPVDSSLQKELADTEKARLQTQLEALQSRAEQAIRAGDWGAAVEAYKQAAKLAPDDPAWLEKIEATQSAKLQAQLDAFQKQADEAVSDGQWEAAIQVIKNAIKAAPDAAPWKEKLAGIETARHQAQLKAYRQEADTARSAGNWDAAIVALEGFLKLEPGETKIQAEIEAIRAEKHQSQLVEFKTQAEKAAKTENWAEAVKAWESYLALGPDDQAKVEATLQRARKYAKISADYAEAQGAIRKKRYGRAIELLQGVIAQDPTYKSTSRLLVEAVEANKAIPIWRRPWVFWALGAMAVVVLGISFGPRLWESISTALQRTPRPTLPAELAFLEPIMTYMAETSPDFEDDFSKANPFWGDSLAEDILIADALKDGAINLELEAGTPREKLVLQSGNMRNITNFGMEFDFYFEGSTPSTDMGVGFESLNDGTNAQVKINLDGQNWFIGLTDGTVEHSGEIDKTLQGQWAHLQMFFVDGYLVGFLNGKFLGHAEGISSLRQNVWIYAYSGGQAAIQIDNLKFWNLEGVELSAITPAPEPTLTPPPTQTAATPPPTATASSPASDPSSFYQPILDYITGTTPDFEEDFSNEKAYWSDLNLNSDATLKDAVGDGVLHAAGNASDTSADAIQYNFSLKDLQALEFVLQFDFARLAISSDTHVYVVFRQDEQNSEYWLVLWQSGGWAIEKRDEGVSTQIDSGVTSYESERANTLQIIAKGPTFAILLNDKLLTYFEDDSISGETIGFGAHSLTSLQYDFDNIKFWDLSGADFSASTESIRAYIASTPPDFTDDFSSDKWGDLADGISTENFLFDDVLLLGLEFGTDYEKLVLSGPNIEAAQFVLEFDFQFEEGNGGTRLDVGFLSLSNDTPGGFSIHLEEQTWTIGFAGTKSSNGEITDPLKGQRVHLQVIYFEKSIAAFLNGQFLGSADGIDHFGTSTWITASTESGAKIWLDDIQFWNLDYMDPAKAFYQPILAYTAGSPPTFEDDFSKPDMVWGGNSGGYAIYAMVKDGVLIMHDRGTREDSIPDVPGEIFPTNGLLNASNFALQFDFVFETDRPVNSVAVQFRSYELLFNRNGAWTLYENGGSSQTGMDGGSSYLNPSKNTLLIIAHNENLAIYLNNTLLFITNEIALTGIENRIIVSGDYETYMEFDNVKFWNLNSVDFDTTSAQSESSSPKIDHKSGDIQKSSMDGMDMVYIAAGEFLMGASDLDATANESEKPQHKVYLDAYWIDRTEVTNAMFAAFLNSQGNQKENGYYWLDSQGENVKIVQSQGVWQAIDGFENHPVTHVSWFGSGAYCEWADRRLPTEAEWEKAARGTDGRKFPWGPIFDCRNLNSDDETKIDAQVSERANCDGYTDSAPVGSFLQGASPYGVWDMAGNAAEWVSDLFSVDYYAISPASNPQGPTLEQANGYIQRGSHWALASPIDFRTTYRSGTWLPGPRYGVGFRCAMTP